MSNFIYIYFSTWITNLRTFTVGSSSYFCASTWDQVSAHKLDLYHKRSCFIRENESKLLIKQTNKQTVFVCLRRSPEFLREFESVVLVYSA